MAEIDPEEQQDQTKEPSEPPHIALSKALYALKCGEGVVHGSNMQMIRVPGGWLYVLFDRNDPLPPVFVPYHNEFMIP